MRSGILVELWMDEITMLVPRSEVFLKRRYRNTTARPPSGRPRMISGCALRKLFTNISACPNADAAAPTITPIAEARTDHITSVLAECIKVPCWEYQRHLFSEFKRTAKLEITTSIEYSRQYGYGDALFDVDSVVVKDQVLPKYTFVEWNFDNNYRIDQVILEPVEAPSNESDVK